jgi:CheY-like chemotaxis protein
VKVFIVEDAPQTRQELVELLAAVKGLEVVGQAGSVREAIAGIESTTPQAVTLDISLPDGSGIDFVLSPGASRQLGDAIYPEICQAKSRSSDHKIAFIVMNDEDGARGAPQNIFSITFVTEAVYPFVILCAENDQMSIQSDGCMNNFFAEISTTKTGLRIRISAFNLPPQLIQGFQVVRAM